MLKVNTHLIYVSIRERISILNSKNDLNYKYLRQSVDKRTLENIEKCIFS